MIKILLIRPKPPNETIGLQHVMICEPLELEYLAGNIPSDKAQVEIVDMILEKRSLARLLKQFEPDLVGMTGYITHVGVIKSYAKIIKGLYPNALTVVGGVHAEVVPQDFLDEHIDFIIYDEPIATFLRLVDYARDKRISAGKKMKDKKNKTLGTLAEKRRRMNEKAETFRLPFSGGDEAHRIQGVYTVGKPLEKTKGFDYLPPDRQKVARYRKKYYYMFHNPCALVKTSFGCPYNCSFCFCKEITGGAYYARDIHEVVEELRSILEREIYMVDDDFLFDEKRLERFCDLLEQHQLDKRFLVYGRADFIAQHPQLMERLAKNGLSAVIVGIESARKQDLIDFNKKTNVQINKEAIKILQQNDIELYATMILHMDYGKEDFLELEEFIKEMGIAFVNLQPLTPLPGTDIFDQYQEKILVAREDYAKWDLAHVVLQPEKLTIRQYYYQIIRLYMRIVMSPQSIQKMIKKYGLKQVLKMSWGSHYVTRQYLSKMLFGK